MNDFIPSKIPDAATLVGPPIEDAIRWFRGVHSIACGRVLEFLAQTWRLDAGEAASCLDRILAARLGVLRRSGAGAGTLAKALIDACNPSAKATFERRLARLGSSAIGKLRGKGVAEPDANDIVQTAFTRVFANLKAGQLEIKTSLEAFCRTSFHNAYVDYVRKRHREGKIDRVPASPFEEEDGSGSPGVGDDQLWYRPLHLLSPEKDAEMRSLLDCVDANLERALACGVNPKHVRTFRLRAKGWQRDDIRRKFRLPSNNAASVRMTTAFNRCYPYIKACLEAWHAEKGSK
ncbi:MAG TPA: hypothetical protein VMF52_12250 [Steroidobacteraceae bacterium]|nr:hypothetical protein [Steroidobacteraceae bacterium]